MKEYITLISPDSGQEYSIRVCTSFIDRLMGYMFQKQPRDPALLFSPCNSIHMFGMKFPVDVLFLGESYLIIKRVNNLQPGKIVLPVRGARMALEAPVGALDGLVEGTYLTIKK